MNIEYRLGELFFRPWRDSIGAKWARYQPNGSIHSISHVWGTDYDKDTCETYYTNICPDAPQTVLCRDIRKLDLEELAKISEIDGFVFGFPCNDFVLLVNKKE